MFKGLFSFILIFLLIGAGNANANPLRNFSGPSYIDQTAEFLNNITRNWTDLPIGKIIITHILENEAGHSPKVILQDDEKDIMLMIVKQSGQLSLNNEYCTIFDLRITNKTGQLDSQFSSFLCLNSVDQTSSLRIKNIDYTPVNNQHPI